MYSYSSSSMSLYGNRSSSRNSTPTRRAKSRSPVSSPAPECPSPKRTPTVSTPPPPSECKSPFTTPNHPLYMFGDSHDEADTVVPKPTRPQKVKNCLDSMNDLSLSSPREEAPSPFRRLQLSRTFDHNDEQEETFQATPPRKVLRHPQSPPQVVQHREIRRSNAFGMEQMRELSIDSVPSLQEKLSLIEGDLEGADGLALRLRRMKRRLFLENVASSPQNESGLEEETPKHSNRMLSEDPPMLHDVTMEGMEVVLEDQGGDAPTTNSDSMDGFYLTFSSSSSSLQMEIEQEDDEDEDYPSSETADWLMVPTKQLSGDSSVVTEATAACSTFGNGDTHWASLSSITEHE